MNLSAYVDAVRQGVTDAAALADEHTQQVAARLGHAIDSSTRLAVIQALSDAAGTISAELAPGSVEVRMAGADPEFVVSVPSPSTEPRMLLPEDGTTPAEPLDDPGAEDEPLARISLRLPASVKTRVDQMADRDGISTNAWLIRAVVDALADRRRTDGPPPPAPPAPPSGGVFGPNGPFGPHGIFGAGGPFGPGRGDRSRASEQGHPGSTGGVQGWVR